ncbi:nitrilase-related carbon-nitrogen hydrolase [candidate division CSSED10-310 bacterium]|uniref:Nitrilase-related carbon-nitrogen hydrolase n=1 Tax=candidate division CSSED10-310 bacterium TaxID=2855610 RepID=A0ABV6Z4K0_UNCC1
MKVGYIQNKPQFGRIENNLADIHTMLHEVSVDVLVLPELFASGYLFLDRDELSQYAETPWQGPSTTFLQELTTNLDSIVVGGFAEKCQGKLYNAAALVTPEGQRRIYRKIHLFDQEKFIFDQSDSEFWVETPLGNIGVMICFDWIFPEAARTLALMGADIIAHPSNLVLPHCPEAMKTRALENRVFTITANRIGTDQRDSQSLSFIGNSRIYSPSGEILAASDSDTAEMKGAEISISDARQKKITAHNDVLLDRRPDRYLL